MPLRVVFVAACGFGLAVASIDQMTAIPWIPGKWLVASDLVPSFATAALAAAAVLWAAWLFLRPLLRWLRVDGGPGLAALVSFGLTAVVLLSWPHILDLDLFAGTDLAQKLSALLAALGVVAATYAISGRSAPGGIPRRWLARLCMAVPVLLVAGTLWTWGAYREAPLGFSVWAAVPLGALCVGVWFLGSVRVNAMLLTAAFLVPVTAAALILAGRSPFERQASGFTESRHERSHFILITVDTLRADVLSVYDGEAPETPSFEALAEESVVFDRARSDSSWTLPSLASLLTGLPSLSLRVGRGSDVLPLEVPTLAERFRDAGYYTAAVAQNPLLDPRLNYFQGFEEYALIEELNPEQESLGREILQALLPAQYRASSTEGVTAVAEQWLQRNHGRDFFLWIHYYDPHVPYAPPPAYMPHGEAPPRIGSNFNLQDRVRRGLRLTGEERDWAKKLYLAEVEYIDSHIGRLVSLLRELGVYDDALIALTSDHGEEFWEHGRFEHGHSLYDEVLRVPLFIKLPGSTATGRVETPVSNRFVAPTFLEAAGLEINDRCSNPPSLSGLWRGASGEEFGPYTATSTMYYDELHAILAGNLKLIRSATGGRDELYDLAADPGETRSLAGVNTGAGELLGQALDDLEASYERLLDCYGATASEAPRRSPAAIEKLRSLGYIQ